MAGLACAMLAAACEPSDRTAVVDGEHVVVRGHRLQLHQLDAPDATSPGCEAEAELARRATERLDQLLTQAAAVEFRKTGMACLQFMTCDAFVTADGADVGETLISEGLAARGVVEGETTRDWCAT